MFSKLISGLDQRATLMGRMMNHMDVDVAACSAGHLGTTFTRAAHRCMACRNAPECQAFLDSPTLDVPGPETFCLNYPLFVAMRKDVPAQG